MVLSVLPMVELVGVAEGVHDGLEDRLQNLGVAIYTKSIHKKNQEASSKITTHCRPPPVRVSSKRLSLPPHFKILHLLNLLNLQLSSSPSFLSTSFLLSCRFYFSAIFSPLILSVIKTYETSFVNCCNFFSLYIYIICIKSIFFYSFFLMPSR